MDIPNSSTGMSVGGGPPVVQAPTAGVGGGVATIPAVPANPVPNPATQSSLVNPLIQQAPPALPVSPAAVPVSPIPVGVGTAAPTAAMPDEDSNQDDAVWVGRAKRIIAQTQGDPYRQVQLLQQLSVVFLKERYGRSVHSDDT